MEKIILTHRDAPLCSIEYLPLVVLSILFIHALYDPHSRCYIVKVYSNLHLFYQPPWLSPQLPPRLPSLRNWKSPPTMLLLLPRNADEEHQQQEPPKTAFRARSAKSSVIVDVHTVDSVSKSAKTARATEPPSHGELA